MSERILMQVSGDVRPLQLSPTGSTLSSGLLSRWGGVPLEVHRVRDWEGDANMGPENGAAGLLVFLAGQVEFLSRRGGRDRTWVSRAGQSTLISGDECPRLLACRGEAQVAAIDLSSGWVKAATGADQPVLRTTMPLGQQSLIARQVRALVGHLQQPDASEPLVVESLSLDLMSSILSELPAARVRVYDGRLTPAMCRQLRDYVEAHLSGPVSLAELARLSGCSPRHFSSLFKEAFAITPHQYVLRARLMAAARLLRASQRDLAQVAYEVGFSSQSHFSTAFHRAFRVRPSDYARHFRTQVALTAR